MPRSITAAGVMNSTLVSLYMGIMNVQMNSTAFAVWFGSSPVFLLHPFAPSLCPSFESRHFGGLVCLSFFKKINELLLFLEFVPRWALAEEATND